MRRYPSRNVSSFSFGPGPVSTALKALIGANVVMFLVQFFQPIATELLGLQPVSVMRNFWVWQLATYMFLHGGIFHIVFNMLALWMFGAELEGIWGTRYFLKFYFVTGIGAGLLTVLFSLLPFGFAQQVYGANVIYMYLVFPIPAKIFVMIMGAIAFFSSMGESGGTANATHLGGLAVGYLFLKSGRVHPLSELRYRYWKWKINRVRKKFDVYSGGRADDWDRRVH
jgi:membrane associated rhomboid family serine protease